MEEINKPREYTQKEISAEFLKYVKNYIQYWECGSNASDSLSKLEGLAFSILAMIDGESELPKFILAPDPHEDDKEYCIRSGRNYYPENNKSQVNSDISGDLHNIFSLEYKTK